MIIKIIKYINMKPIIKWSGGKKDEIKNILKYIPENYDYYIEPFIGSGALFFHLEHNKSIINDTHKELINFYNEIKNGNSIKIYDLMNKSKNNEEDYYKIRNMEYNTDIQNAYKFYYLRKTCYRGMLRYNLKGKFNVPFGRYKNINYNDLLDENYYNLLKTTKIYNKDFEYVLNKYNNENNFCFIDQPYDTIFNNYGYNNFTKEDQERLANIFKNTKIKCLMVVAETPLIKNLYNKYIVEIYDKKYRFKLHSGRINDDINKNHLIIKNY